MNRKFDFPHMYVGQIMDKRTLVVTGEGVKQLQPGDRLQVLAVGKRLMGTDLPLVVPKATLEVLSSAGKYVVASPPEVTYEQSTSMADILSLSTKKVFTERPALPVREDELTGNPADAPISVGDPVVTPSGLPSFVEQLAASAETESR